MSRSATEKDIDTLTRTVWGEARGEPDEGKAAVAHVVINRAKSGNAYGEGIEGVCRKDQQFSCWNKDDVNRGQIDKLDTNNQEYKKNRRIVEEVLNGTRPDNTKGSTHYHRTDTPHNWASGKRPAAEHGAHSFYNNID
ncbi:unnamed protein product [Adineta ricciae]|uniref:Cell wall hydrolase SleB domain-containing protein n=1 Tax=Adineta ricciae TaxID=249248 RepID=A0A814Z4F6_ADIRI|nr:unnamed protein product [Adineta ricciae]CAF1283386.1 unnamed protein product [Adineta ricciae]